MVNIMIQWMMPVIVTVLHPFYLSVVEVNHNPKEASVELSVRIFTEDLEKTIKKYTTAHIDISNPPNRAFINSQISAYINQKLKLKVNSQPVSYNFIGYEVQKESTWCYFEATKIPDMKKLEVDCSLLYDYEEAQTNIFHVKSRGTEKSYKLDYPKTVAVFDF